MVLPSPEELAVDRDKTLGSQPEPEAAAVRETQREEAKALPAPATPPSGRHCPAVGCAYEGDERARVAHWRGSHLVVLPLWMCPVARCKHRCRNKEALLSHLMVSTVERIMQLPPLVEMVENSKFQAQGDVTPLARPEAVLEEALPYKSKADLGAQVSVILQSRNVGKVLLPTPSAAAFDIKVWVGLLVLPPPPPPLLPPAEPVKGIEVAEISLPPPPSMDEMPPPPTDELSSPSTDKLLPPPTDELPPPSTDEMPPPPEDALPPPLTDNLLMPPRDLLSPVDAALHAPPPSMGSDLDATRDVMPPPPAPAAEELSPAGPALAAEDPPRAAPAPAAEEPPHHRLHSIRCHQAPWVRRHKGWTFRWSSCCANTMT